MDTLTAVLSNHTGFDACMWECVGKLKEISVYIQGSDCGVFACGYMYVSRE